MNRERRTLEDWERQECLALKQAIASYNATVPKISRLTQDDLADALGMSQGTLSSHLNGHRAINKEMAAKVSRMIGIPVETFSTRLAKELSELALAPFQQVDAERPAASLGTEQAELEILEAFHALTFIRMSIVAGMINRDQIKRLLQIRNEIAHKGISDDRVVVPDRLKGLLAAAFENAEKGETPDDLLRMYQLSMEKQFLAEGSSSDEAKGKRSTRA